MQLTHEEARRLIQFDADQTLAAEKRSVLSAHLEICSECSRYAQDIQEIGNLLLPAMKRHWSSQSIPFSVDTLVRNEKSKRVSRSFRTTRSVLIGVILFGFVFSAWQFMISSQRSPGQLHEGVPPVPTPSVQSTGTKQSWEDCEMRAYVVQENDTIASIARRFSASEEVIIALNALEREKVHRSMELVIPICHSTPTGTAAVPTFFTTTDTPLASLPSSTPDG